MRKVKVLKYWRLEKEDEQKNNDIDSAERSTLTQYRYGVQGESGLSQLVGSGATSLGGSPFRCAIPKSARPKVACWRNFIKGGFPRSSKKMRSLLLTTAHFRTFGRLSAKLRNTFLFLSFRRRVDTRVHLQNIYRNLSSSH
jgi:hypothetical protein